MPTLCCIVSCSNKQKKGLDLSFFRIPSIIRNEGTRAQELSERRRRMWFAAINREDAAWKKVDCWRVCSKHFSTGKPSSLMDESNPDWVPTLHLGYDKIGAVASNDATMTYSRYSRAKRRRENKVQRSGENLRNLDQRLREDDSEASNKAMRHEHLPEDNDTLSSDKKSLYTESAQYHLHGVVCPQQELRKVQCFLREDDLEDSSKVCFYTGLPSKLVLMATFTLISPGIAQQRNSVLSKFDKFVITLVRLRLNLQVKDLAYRYDVTPSVISKAFAEVIDLLYENLKGVILWPAREQLRKTMPTVFQENFGLGVVSIIDCFEVFIERPSNLYARAQTWSNYKHHNTVKYLISIAPQGLISFISDGWGGRASDKHVTMMSKFVKKLLPGDIVLADIGFDIGELIAMEGAKLHIPAFTRGKNQLSGKEVEHSRKIFNVRIHVERIIGVLRQKYTILQSTIPITLLITKAGEEKPVLDKIVTIACALTNLCPSVVPFH